MPSSFTILRRVDSGIAIGHFFEVIDQVHFHVFRHEIFTDAFGDVWVDLVLVEFTGLLQFGEDRAVRIDPEDLDVRVLLLQVPSRTADGSSCSNADYKVRDLAFGLFPDLGASAFVVGLARC
jgi:hypothetical protein